MEQFPGQQGFGSDDEREGDESFGTGPTRRDRDQEMRQRLGLFFAEPMSPEERMEKLGSIQRMQVYESIQAETMPPTARAEQKRGIIAEMLRQNLVSEEIFKHQPVVYFGSGLDVEYPLAMGARHVVMYDPMFKETLALDALKDRLVTYAGAVEGSEDKKSLKLSFDFGNGPEDVDITVIDDSFETDNPYHGPDQIGLIILFASHGAGYATMQDERLKSKIAEGGGILSMSEFTPVSGGKEGKSVVLGK